MKKGQKIVVANWKMNPETDVEAKRIFAGIIGTARRLRKVLTVICPPSLFVHLFKERTISALALGVQDFFYEEIGPYTGEISVGMIKKMNATYSIIGHSERRKLGETHEAINKKIHLALKNKITPIVCIGEESRDEEGKYLSIIREQLEKALVSITISQLSKITIAYEPVWAIGARSAMDPHDIHQMKIFITKSLIEMYRTKNLGIIPILYGGAVDPTNARSIFTLGEADGLLIGRTSLDPQAFGEILKIANAL